MTAYNSTHTEKNNVRKLMILKKNTDDNHIIIHFSYQLSDVIGAIPTFDYTHVYTGKFLYFKQM